MSERGSPPADLALTRIGHGAAQFDYLTVAQRILWLRREHPDAEIITEPIRIDDHVAIFKATVSIPDGGEATGHGSETASDFRDYIEKAETKALGRALHNLGYDLISYEEGEGAATTASPRRQQPVTRREIVSWTEFWRLARAAGYKTRDEVEAAIGQSVTNLTPAAALALLIPDGEVR